MFFGLADLSASMDHRGQPGHPEVQKVILDGIATVCAAGKAAGILATDPALAQQYLDAGALFVAVGGWTRRCWWRRRAGWCSGLAVGRRKKRLQYLGSN